MLIQLAFKNWLAPHSKKPPLKLQKLKWGRVLVLMVMAAIALPWALGGSGKKPVKHLSQPAMDESKGFLRSPMTDEIDFENIGEHIRAHERWQIAFLGKKFAAGGIDSIMATGATTPELIPFGFILRNLFLMIGSSDQEPFRKDLTDRGMSSQEIELLFAIVEMSPVDERDMTSNAQINLAFLEMVLRYEDPQTIPEALINANRHDQGFLSLDTQREWAIGLIEPLSLKSRMVLISYLDEILGESGTSATHFYYANNFLPVSADEIAEIRNAVGLHHERMKEIPTYHAQALQTIDELEKEIDAGLQVSREHVARLATVREQVLAKGVK